MPDKSRLSLTSAPFCSFPPSLFAFYSFLLHSRHLHLEFQALSLPSNLTTLVFLLCSSHFFLLSGMASLSFPCLVCQNSIISLRCPINTAFSSRSTLISFTVIFPSEFSLHFAHISWLLFTSHCVLRLCMSYSFKTP